MDIGNLAGRTIDEYTLVEIIGEGGMSAVYRAYQDELERYVAVKILSGDLAKQPDYLRRFNHEAKLSASLEHPHIVPVYDFGVSDDLTFVVMRLLDTTLTERNTSGQSINDVIVMVEAIAKALDYAHSRGVIHRDVKPSNIMFDTQGTPYLVDFGIAKAVQSDLNLTAEHLVMGTPSYMSPEQWRDENVTPKVDQYALAVVLFQTLTGELPFTGTTSSQVMYKHLHEPPPKATDINPSLPEGVNHVLQRGMAKDPNNRYPLVSNFSNGLRDALISTRAPQTALRHPAPQPSQPSQPSTPKLPSQPANKSDAADATYEQPAAPLNTPQRERNTPQPTPSPVSLPRVRESSRQFLSTFERRLKQDTVMTQVVKGGIIGLAVLLIIAILIVLALIATFSPDTPETNAIPTEAQVINAPSDLPVVAVTNRADATATLQPRGPIITPAVDFVGMNASQVREVGQLVPVNPVPVRDAVYSPDGVMVAAGDGNGTVILWREGVNGSSTNLSGHRDVVSTLAFNPDGSILASAGRDTTIHLWDTATGETIGVLSGHTGAVRDVAFSPDGQILASGAEDGTLRLWNLADGQQIRSINADASRVLAVAFSPEGQTVATGGRSGLVRLWNPETGEERSNLTWHVEEVRSVDFSPDGQYIASSSTDNSAIIWRRDNGARAQTLELANDIFSVAFSPDSTILATGGRDNNLRLWDVANGQELNTLGGHIGWVFSVAFAPDGASLITGSGDGSVRIWSAN